MGFAASARRWRRQRHKRRRSDRVGVVRRKPLSLNQFCFKYHYWAALVTLVPWLLVVAAGVVLQLRHEIPGVTPDYKQGVSNGLRLDYQQVLEVAKTIPELQVVGWSDIWRVYSYPGKGVMEIRTKIGYGAQLDAATGIILDVYARGSDFWEDLHEGIFGRHQLNGMKIFGDTKVNLSMWVFLPVNIIALFLWFSGVVVAFRTSVEKAATARVPAAAKEIPAVAASAAASGEGIRLSPGADVLPDFGNDLPSTQSRHADEPDPDQRRREAREFAQRLHAAARYTARRRADISEGSARVPAQVPNRPGTRQSRGRAAWRRRTG